MTNTELTALIISDDNPTAALWATAIALGLTVDNHGAISLSLGMTRQALHKRVKGIRACLNLPPKRPQKKRARTSIDQDAPSVDWSHPVFKSAP